MAMLQPSDGEGPPDVTAPKIDKHVYMNIASHLFVKVHAEHKIIVCVIYYLIYFHPDQVFLILLTIQMSYYVVTHIYHYQPLHGGPLLYFNPILFFETPFFS